MLREWQGQGKKTGECGSESCDGESEETELKQMGRSDKGVELSVVSHFQVRELTVNHWGIVNQLCIISGSTASKNVSSHSTLEHLLISNIVGKKDCGVFK